MSNVVGERCQITIGEQVREHLGVRPGDRAVEGVEAGRLVVAFVPKRSDPRYGGFFEHRAASARVELQPIGLGRARVVVHDFMSPSIIEGLRGQEGVLSPRIEDWRAMVDSVMILVLPVTADA